MVENNDDFCEGCAKRRKALKRFIKKAFTGGNKSVSVPEKDGMDADYVASMNARFGKKKK